MEFVIRKANAQDISGIMKIMKEAAENPLHPEWFVPDDEAFIRGHLEKKGFVIVAESEKKEIAGFFLVKYPEPEENLGIYLGFSGEKLERTAVMDSAAVGSAYRGNGLQGNMLEMAESLLDKERYRYLMCTVHPDNRYSLENMRKHGYEIQRTVQCYGGLTRYILLKEIKLTPEKI